MVFVEPGKRLRLIGGLGPLQELGVAASMTCEFAQSGGATDVVLTYHVSGYGAKGLDALASPVSSVLSEQLARLKRYVESGNP